jgi:uncharacterized protein (DUF2141 family)
MIYPVLILILNSFNINYSLNINIENINPSKGQLMIAVYNSKQLYMKTEKAVSKQILKLNGKNAEFIQFKDLPMGEYSVAVIHDENNNGKLDTNIFGIPTEAYGFSNNIRPKFRAANWDETKFLMNKNVELNIKLDKW